MSNAGMVGAATAVLLLTRDPVMKKLRGPFQPLFWRLANRLFWRQYSRGFRVYHRFNWRWFRWGDGGAAWRIYKRGRRSRAVSTPLIADGKYLQYIGVAGWLCSGFCIDLYRRQSPRLR